MLAARLFLSAGWLLLTALSLRGDDQTQAADVDTLKKAGLKSDGPALLAFFRQRTLSQDQVAQLTDNMRRLGDNAFPVRQQASADLVKAGAAAVPFLQRALTDPDLEVVRRAERCLQEIKHRMETSQVLAAARLLAVRQADRAPEVLLNYLPFADDPVVEEELLATLAVVGFHKGKVDPALSVALTDAMPGRRAAAGYLLGQSTEGGVRARVRPLLTDTDARVRFQAARGLLAGGEKEAVPALLALLTNGPKDLAWQAEDQLGQLAGDQTPRASVGTGTDEERRRSRDAWTTWWSDHGDRLSLEKPDPDKRHLGLTLIVSLTGYKGSGRVWERGPDGKPRWDITDAKGPIDAQMVSTNRVLIAEYNGQRVTERDRQGKILWQYDWSGKQPLGCQRLANGHTVIATIHEIREVDAQGSEVASFFHNSGTILSFQKLRNGHLVYLTYEGILRELDEKGKELMSFRFDRPTEGLVTVEALPGGHYLIPLTAAGRVAEFDAAGKELRHWSMPHATAATRLANGNILACSNKLQRVVEMTPGGSVVWEEQTEGRVFRVRRR
jgi:hypothetical protein